MTTHYDEKKDYARDADHIEAHQDTLGYGGGSVGEKDHDHYVSDAAHAADAQKSQTVRAALAMYKPAIIFSVVMSAAIIMEGYDTLLLGQFYAQDAFARRFGEYVESDGTWQIPSKWQISLGVSVQVGSILGLQITGWASERIGYRKTMGIALVALTGILFIQFFAVNIEMLLAGYLLLGFPWGTFQTMTVSYAAEVMPVQLRPFLTTYVNLCWVIGQIICSGVNRAFIGNTSEWAYKIPFAIQWIWPVPIFIGIVFAPESPFWLVRKGKFEEAEKALMRLTTRSSGYSIDDAKAQVALIHHTNELEKTFNQGSSYFDCFKLAGGNLRRTEIACMVWLIQTICGSPLMGMATYFFRQAGLAADTASTLNLVMFAVGAVGTISSWPLMAVAGRRTIYNWGQVGLSCLMLLTGVLGCIKETPGRGWGIGALLIIFTGLYDLTVGPVCYSLVAEIGSTRLRSKTVVLARNLYNVGGIVVSILNPLMLNPGDWNWGPKSAFLWLGTGVLGLVWSYFRLPEPKGRTYGELDILFERKIPARKFRETIVDQFEAEQRDAEIIKATGGGGAAMAH